MMTSCRIAITAVAFLVMQPPAARAQAFTAITSPLQVPLHWRSVDNDPNKPRKLGLYATIGGGTTPQLFEFDTGGDGLYASYATGTAAPWWGGGYTPIAGGTFSQIYDSGLTYTGTAVTTSISLFASGTAASPLLTATDVVVGLTSGMTQPGAGTLWPLPSGTSPPPTNGAFFGDFGMAPKQGQAGIDSLVAQLAYGAGVAAGFRVHAASENPWVQFGLAAGDLAVLPTTFALNAAIGSSAAGVPYYQPLVVTGSLDVQKDNAPFAQPTGLVFDTGASTTIHNSGTNVPFPAHLTKDHAGTEVVHNASFAVSGSSLAPGGGWQTIIQLTTGGVTDVDKVAVQFSTLNPDYYLNTGILPFTQHDVIFNLTAGQLTLAPVPEPSLATIAVAAWIGIGVGARAINVRSSSRGRAAGVTTLPTPTPASGPHAPSVSA